MAEYIKRVTVINHLPSLRCGYGWMESGGRRKWLESEVEADV